ncbi:hypothetical protein BDW22DRAFT_1338445 [Trametopsis cervina]|nr:hypothetical protein BDW22DRAFT_1338445 [Trametopsis cervina]
MSPAFSNILVHGPASPVALSRLKTYFTTVTHVPEFGLPVSAEQYAAADVIYALFIHGVKSANDVPNLKFLQLYRSGIDDLPSHPLIKDPKAKDIPIATAAGVHARAIPQYFIMTTLALFHRLQQQILISFNEKRWATSAELTGDPSVPFENRDFAGKTVGILGYGHIGRESARLAVAFGAKIIVATPSGTKKPASGFDVVPGTGDPDGSLPLAWYSSANPSSFTEFVAQSDVLLVAAPSTPATRKLLNAETLAALKPTSVIVNIGRGDIIDTDALVAALDAGKIAGAALDVTDPEPLPAGHTLFGRPNVIITPHRSGTAQGYFEHSFDVLMTNLQRLVEGKPLHNLVDIQKGY